MRRILIPFVLLVGVLTLTASGLADPGDKGKGKAQGKNKFSFQLTTTDNRCNGIGTWATLTEKRTYQLHKNKDGSYRLRRVDKGTFTTTDGISPGNCAANKSKHGQHIRAGVTGRFGGYLEGTITGGTFNKNATCAAECTRDVFFPAFFGPANTFSCFENSTDCKFDFKYRAKDQNLKGRSWRDRGTGAGTQLNERFSGDIYNLP